MYPGATGSAAVRVGIIAFGICNGSDLIVKPTKVDSVAHSKYVRMLLRVYLMVIARVKCSVFVDNVVVHMSLSLDIRQADVLNLAHNKLISSSAYYLERLDCCSSLSVLFICPHRPRLLS